MDIFAAFSISAENRLTMRKEIAKLWAVPATVTETLYPPNKPVIKVEVVARIMFIGQF